MLVNVTNCKKTYRILMCFMNKFTPFKCVYVLRRTQFNYFSRLQKLNKEKLNGHI